jgi:biopolymer transport protein ExbB/TolQ
MNHKIWIASGILLMAAGFLGTLGGVYRSFYGLTTAQNAGLGDVGGGIAFALFCNVLFIIGFVPLIIGLVKFARKK